MGCNCNEKKYNFSMGCCVPVLAPIENYYTKYQIDEMLEEIESGITSGCCITPEEVDEKIDAAISGITPCDLSDYYTKEEVDAKIPSLSGYATEQWVEDKHYITGVDLSDYALKSEIPTVPTSNTAFTNDAGYLTEHQHLKTINGESIVGDGNIVITGGSCDLSQYWTSAQTESAITSAMTVVENEIPSLSGYATEQWVLDKHYISGVDLSDYVTKDEIPSDIASRRWVDNQNFATNVELLQYVTNLQNQIDALREQYSGCCTDTGTTLTRWVTMTGASDYTCSGTTKMTKEEEEESTDGGNTWTPTGNYRPGSTVLEPNCLDCGYTPEPSNLKYKGDYNNGQSKYVECDGVPSITVWEVQNDVPSTIDNLTGATFYACCEYISNNVLGAANNIKRVEIKEGVISVGGGAFQTSSALTTVIIPNSVKYIDGTAFADCPNLSALTIGSGVTEIGESAFSGDSSLTIDLELPNVTKIYTAAFKDCSGIYGVRIGSGITRIQGSAFKGCSGLFGISVNADVPPTLGAYAFDDTNNCPIYVPKESVDTYKTTYGWRDYADRIQAIPQPKWIATYTGGTTSSAECDASSAITYNEITLTDLISVEIGDCVTSIGEAAFSNCTGLTSITIPDSVTSISYKAFGNCSGLTSMNIPSGVTSIGNMAFSGCTSLTSITIPDSVTRLGDSTFYNCTSLTSCTIGSGVTYIGQNAFSNCSGLTSIDIPNSVTSISNSTFYNCSGLTSVNIPSGVTSIGNWAFGNCSGLTSMNIPSGVTSIGGYAFRYCTSLSGITVNATTPPTLGSNAFYYCDNLTAIYVPASSVDTYKSATNWSDYASIIQAIP